MSQDSQAAHIEARTLILENAREIEGNLAESDTCRVFASAVRAYLEAETLEGCLHLHRGEHVGECRSHSDHAGTARLRYG